MGNGGVRMSNPMAIIGNSVLQLVGGNVYLFLFIILSVWVLFWLYKELRKENWERSGKALERLDKTLETYGALECSLLLYLENTNGDGAKKQLYESVGKSYPYLSINMAEKMQGLYENDAPEYGRECIEMLRKEIKILKNSNAEVVPQLRNGEMSTWFDRAFSTVNSRFFEPFGNALLLLLFVYSLVLVVIMVSQPIPDAVKGEIILIWIALYALAVLVISTIATLVDGKFKQLLRWDGPLWLYIPLFGMLLLNGILSRGVSFILLLGLVVVLISRKRKAM